MGYAPPSSPVAKGPVLHCLDQLSVRDRARERLEQLRAEILRVRGREFLGLEEVFARSLFTDFYRADQIARIATHLRSHWFDQETGWWPPFQPIAPIYALGLLRTLNASLASKEPSPLPIDSYWVIGHGQVDMLTLVSRRQVTLLVMTPPPPDPAPAGIHGETAEAWVTTRRAGRTETEIDPVTEQPSVGGRELRVRTFRVETRRPGPPER
ncbi:MAG TPA: hypothetical protein VNO23_15495 [Candidatus Binatia bacterium]|nr:hypothetical protein [Candidatus Binatia bacterium]